MPLHQLLLSLSTEERDGLTVVCLTMLQQRSWKAEQNLFYINFSLTDKNKMECRCSSQTNASTLIDETKNYSQQQDRIENIFPFTSNTTLLRHDVYTYHYADLK
jgi:hypothetical protein